MCQEQTSVAKKKETDKKAKVEEGAEQLFVLICPGVHLVRTAVAAPYSSARRQLVIGRNV